MDLGKPHISVAPMLDWTDRHDRYFLRLISPHARLYTEMVTTGALMHGDRDRFLAFDPSENPLALQLGGSNPAALAACARMGEDYGYDEINLNCGCPSDRVQEGSFGACLMAEPQRVADCVAAMRAATRLPVTVKCRIGIDDCEDEPFLLRFLDTVSAAGTTQFIVHARKAWLKGLSPKENREIPPLRYDLVESIRRQRPHLSLILNGGLKTLPQVQDALTRFDGAMIGREAYQNPWILAEIERDVFGRSDTPNRADIARAMMPYIAQQRARGVPVKSITRHMLGLFQGQRGARSWRRILTVDTQNPQTDESVILRALEGTYLLEP